MNDMETDANDEMAIIRFVAKLRITQLESDCARLKTLLADVWNKYSGISPRRIKDSELEARIKREGIEN